MHRRRLAALVAIGLAAVGGCRSAHVNSHIETVNAEYRQLEDYVYCLEDENARLQHELEALRAGRPAASTAPRRGFLQRPDVPEIEAPDVPSETPPRRPGRPGIDRQQSPPAAPDLEPPTVELSSAAMPLAPADTDITQLFLNPVFTGGSDLDGQQGDDGLTIVIEPRNAAGEYVPQAGALSVVVLDPSRAGEAARVARWDLSTEAIERKLSEPKAARGIHLAMPWPAGPPTSERLHLFVRLETQDGRRIQADREIFLTQPGQASQRWTPRQPRPVAPPEEQGAAESQPRPPLEDPGLHSESPAQAAASPPAWSPLR